MHFIFRVESCVAARGQGLKDGYKWLVKSGKLTYSTGTFKLVLINLNALIKKRKQKFFLNSDGIGCKVIYD